MTLSLTLVILLSGAAGSLTVDELDAAPVGPLQRENPLVHDVLFEIVLHAEPTPDGLALPQFELRNVDIMMPLVMSGVYSRIDGDKARMRLWLQHREDEKLGERVRLDRNLALGTSMAIAPVAHFRGNLMRWNLSFPAQVWSSRLDDRRAAELRWPQEWPEAVQSALQPQAFIESDDPIFSQAVERISEGRLRLTAPLLAAKDIIRHAITKVQVNDAGMVRGGHRELMGMKVDGAKFAGEKGLGSPHDVVCVCIAMLRAAKIPARPVIGIQKGLIDGRYELVSWGELYLNGAGWIPFDPTEMRRRGIANLRVADPWPGFGSLSELNQRIPLAYHFIPPREAEVSVYPAIWGWHPPAAKNVIIRQTLRLETQLKGEGTDEPR